MSFEIWSQRSLSLEEISCVRIGSRVYNWPSSSTNCFLDKLEAATPRCACLRSRYHAPDIWFQGARTWFPMMFLFSCATNIPHLLQWYSPKVSFMKLSLTQMQWKRCKGYINQFFSGYQEFSLPVSTIMFFLFRPFPLPRLPTFATASRFFKAKRKWEIATSMVKNHNSGFSSPDPKRCFFYPGRGRQPEWCLLCRKVCFFWCSFAI